MVVCNSVEVTAVLMLLSPQVMLLLRIAPADCVPLSMGCLMWQFDCSDSEVYGVKRGRETPYLRLTYIQ